jgi:hypothetical protein
VLDFDDCGWGHFLYDLAPLLGNLSDADRFPPLARAFLAGYRRVRALPAGCDAPPGLAAGHGLPPFHECHGLNAASACDLWLWYYTGAARPPLVYLRDGPLAGVWRGLPLGPENAVAVRGRRALLAGHGFPVRALQWTLVDLATGAREAVRPATPDGQAVDWERPFACGSCLYGWDGPRLLAYDLRHLERHLAGGGAPPGGHG